MTDHKLKQQIAESKPGLRHRKQWRGWGGIAFVMTFMFAALLASCRQAELNSVPTETQTVQTTPTPKLTEQVLKDTAWDPQWPPLPNASVPAQPLDQVRAMYAFAARHPEVLQHAPCYCGCESGGHENVRDCFVKGKTADGKPQWDGMGFM
jgi:hypothetical protein